MFKKDKNGQVTNLPSVQLVVEIIFDEDNNARFIIRAMNGAPLKVCDDETTFLEALEAYTTILNDAINSNGDGK